VAKNFLISVLQLGTVDYATGLRLQERLVELRDDAGRALILGLRAIRLEELPHGRVLLRVVDLTDRISLERRLTESEHLATLGRLLDLVRAVG